MASKKPSYSETTVQGKSFEQYDREVDEWFTVCKALGTCLLVVLLLYFLYETVAAHSVR